jgi:hypothetical protein
MPYADKNRQRAAQRESARRRRLARAEPKGRTRTRTFGPLVSADVRLETARDVLATIEGQVAAVLGDEDMSTIERARVIATLARVVLRAIEAGDLAARIEALEGVLRSRRAA